MAHCPDFAWRRDKNTPDLMPFLPWQKKTIETIVEHCTATGSGKSN
jgi:hypothetical protein